MGTSERPSTEHLDYLIRIIRTQLFSWKLTKSLHLNMLLDIHWIIIVLIWRNNYSQTFSICCLLKRSGWLFNHASLIIFVSRCPWVHNGLFIHVHIDAPAIQKVCFSLKKNLDNMNMKSKLTLCTLIHILEFIVDDIAQISIIRI